MKQLLIENISISHLKNLMGQWQANKIFLVTGKASYTQSGARQFIESALEPAQFVRFSDFEQNPKYEDALRGLAIFLESGCDAIIAIGGGSAMDIAKLINAFAANRELDSLEIVRKNPALIHKGKPLLAIPTTAGTGSEATHFAVVYHSQKKYSVAHPYLLPDVAGLQPAFTMSQPKYLTACAAMDAFSQAMESFWSVAGTEESRKYAIRALGLLTGNMVRAVNKPDEDNRSALMTAAYYAGRAINISKTTAAHAVSYAFTTFYGIPHGHAVFLTLPRFLEYNYGVTVKDLNDPRGTTYVKAGIEELCTILGADSVREAKNLMYDMAGQMGVELSTTALGIVNFEEKVAANVNTERLGNNPRKISREDLALLLKDN